MATEFDRELLALAAKAAGIKYDKQASDPHPKSGAFWGLWLQYDCEPSEYARRYWNPLKDDGDALRLAVQLNLAVTPYPIYNNPKHSVLAQLKNLDDSRFEVMEMHGNDPCAATRRAIVRAAAQIGRAM